MVFRRMRMKWNRIKEHGKTIGAAVLVLILIWIAAGFGIFEKPADNAALANVLSGEALPLLIVIAAAAALAIDGMKKYCMNNPSGSCTINVVHFRRVCCCYRFRVLTSSGIFDFCFLVYQESPL
jgi:hypothetical protein